MKEGHRSEIWNFQNEKSFQFFVFCRNRLDFDLSTLLSSPLLSHRLINQYLILHSSATPK